MDPESDPSPLWGRSTPSGDGSRHSEPLPPLTRRPDARGVSLIVGYPSPTAIGQVRRRLPGALDVVVVVPRGEAAAAGDDLGSMPYGPRVRVVEGSAAEPGLGLGRAAGDLLSRVVEVVCVGAAADLGRGHVHDFADECPRLRRLVIVCERPSQGRSTPSEALFERAAPVARLALAGAVPVLLGSLATLCAAGRSLIAPVWPDGPFEVVITHVDVEGDLRPWGGLRATGPAGGASPAGSRS